MKNELLNNKKKLILVIALLVALIVCVCVCVSISKKNRQVQESKLVKDAPKIVQEAEDGSGVEVMNGPLDENGKVKNPKELPADAEEAKLVPPQPSTKKLSSKAQEYADYCAMSADEQYEYYKTFKSADAFMKWYNKVKKAYEKENPTVELNPGDAIDFGE